MYRFIFLLSTGSILLAFLVTLQVKFAGVELLSIAKYYLLVLPVLFAANVCIGTGINKGHALYGNLPLLIAIQTAVYYLMITLFSLYLLGDKISVPKTALASVLIITAIYLLKS
ncbi:MAG TPA: hypothetical protein GX532_07920 [Clostridia bacterium]|nr:hypothetical protein [Clostridia bacterium]